MTEEETHRQQLADLLKGILSGSVDLGFKLIPLVGIFAKYKMENGWKESGFKAWLESDPQAPETVAGALEAIQEKIPKDVRDKIVLAMGGIPQ